VNTTVVCANCIAKAVVLLILINGAPVISRKLFKHHAAWPIDFGFRLFDQRPVFGNSKTWRGLLSAILAGTLIAPWLGLSVTQGILFSVFTMLGDLFSSFIKRRLGYVESSCIRGLDTLPESLFPILMLQHALGLSLFDCILVILIFFILDATLSPILYALHIRKRPY